MTSYTPREIDDWIQGQIYSKRTWLKDHGGKVAWSQQDIDAKEYDLSVLEFMSSKYDEKFGRESA